jgi:hypothetical protein
MNLSGSAIRNHVRWLNGSIMVGCLIVSYMNLVSTMAMSGLQPELRIRNLALPGRLQVFVRDLDHYLGAKYTEIRSDPDSVNSKP